MEGLVRGAALGKADVPLALKRIERLQEDRFAFLLAAKLQKRVESRKRRRPDASVGHEIGIILPVAVQRRERPLEEGRCDGRTMLTPLSNSSDATASDLLATWSKRGRSQ